MPWITAILRRQKQQEDEQARRLADSIRDGVHALERGFKNAYESSAPDQKGRQTGGDAKSPSLASEGKGKCKQKEGEQIANPDTLDKLIWLHCSVGEPGSLATEEEEAAASAATQSAQSRTQPLSGFDRLREVGFSEEEIENMRRQFHVDGPSDTTVAGDEDEHARALEEQWMEGFGQNGGNANSDLSRKFIISQDRFRSQDSCLARSQPIRECTRRSSSESLLGSSSLSFLCSSSKPRTPSSARECRWPSSLGSASTFSTVLSEHSLSREDGALLLTAYPIMLAGALQTLGQLRGTVSRIPAWLNKCSIYDIIAIAASALH